MNGTELERIQHKAGEVISSEIASKQNADDLNDLFYKLGGLDVLQTVANNLNAALIVNLQRIRDEEQYRAAGFNRFDAFLDNHPRSPMAYKKFNYIEGIFKTVGPDVFDILSGSGLSLRQRKLLEKGDVEIDGDEILVNHDGEVITFEITNRREWLDSIKVLAKSNAEKAAKLDRQKEKIEKHDAEKKELYAEIDAVRASKAAEVGQDPHSMALANATFALAALREEADRLPAIDRAARKDNVLEILAGCLDRLRQAYRTNAVEQPSDDLVYAIDDDTAWAEELVGSLPDENDSELVSQL